ncbi:MAG: RIO1 family regulatory kinase/ATPase [Actinomycetota bacterium]
MSDDTSTRPTSDVPEWLVPEPFTDVDLGPLRSGKEAQIDLVQRTGADGRSVLLAVKRYVPRTVSHKGELEALGFDRSSAFRHDVQYREGRQFRKSRDRRAVERMTAHGRRLLQNRWTDHEFTVMTALWEAGVAVPYPVSFAEERFVLQYLGDRNGAAPQLAAARLDREQLASAAEQLVDGLHRLAATGWVHGDLSPYNLLWWDETLWFIDFPQAVDLAANPQGLNLLHRDVVNVATWFERKGHPLDAEEVFAQLLESTW